MQQDLAQSHLRYRDSRPRGDERRSFPRYGVVSLLLIVLAWVTSWDQVQPLAQFYFFPIWLGYILFADSLVYWRRGTSLLHQGRASFIGLFAISAIFWWVFEALNIPVQNWRYLGVDGLSSFEYTAFATLPFSTVLPAVLETATLIGSFVAPERYMLLRRVPPPLGRLRILVALGVLAALAPFLWPDMAYGLLWISLIFIVEPVNWLMARPSSFRCLAAGRLELPLTLFCAGITCGFFWEMWNYYSFPKWIYVLPHVHAPKVFEMPLPGYLGYFPFSLELYAMYNLILGLVHKQSIFERVLQLPSARAR